MNDVCFVADLFANQILGGGELNNDVAIIELAKTYNIKKINSHLVDLNFLKQNKNASFIVSNFINLTQESKDYLSNECSYIIYEHDHKYLKGRNPAIYEEFDYKAPFDEIINFDFYRNARTTLCQSKFHSEIVKRNLNIDNITNLGGNLWSDADFENFESFSRTEKKDKCSIMNSAIEHKNTAGAIKYCIHKNYEYDLIGGSAYYDFLRNVSKNDKFVFFPLTPETLSRVVVESRMMNMKVITNKRVGDYSTTKNP